MKIASYGPKNDQPGRRLWTRQVTLDDGRVFQITHQATKRVRIPFKPRGQNIGYHYRATVTEISAGGWTRWSGRVSGSLGCIGILRQAEILT